MFSCVVLGLLLSDGGCVFVINVANLKCQLPLHQINNGVIWSCAKDAELFRVMVFALMLVVQLWEQELSSAICTV
jgi:hypothetical protein